MMANAAADSVHMMVPREKMSRGARLMRVVYGLYPARQFYQAEFGFYSIERWRKRRVNSRYTDLNALFGYDPPGRHHLGGLGWCEAGAERSYFGF